MPFLLKNPIGSAPNYHKPETGTDKQAGGAGSKTVESDTVQQVDDLGTILVTTFFNVLHDYNKILCFISVFCTLWGGSSRAVLSSISSTSLSVSFSLRTFASSARVSSATTIEFLSTFRLTEVLSLRGSVLLKKDKY